MILAGGLMAGLAARFSVPRLFVGGLAGLAVCVGLLSIAPGPWALLLIMFAVGWFVMPVQATTMTIVQQATTNETRGRVAGALNAAIQTASIGVDGGGRDPRRRDRDPGRCSRSAAAIALLAAVVAWCCSAASPRRRPSAVAARSERRLTPAGAGIETAPSPRPAPFPCLRWTRRAVSRCASRPRSC